MYRFQHSSTRRANGSNPLLLLLALGAFIALAGCGTHQAVEDPPTGATATYERGPMALTLSTSADLITTVETLELHLEATLEDGYEVQFPAYPQAEAEPTSDEGDEDNVFTLADYEDAAPVLLDDGRVRRQRTYFLEPFLDGTYTIPALEVRYGAAEQTDDTWLRMETEPLAITVASVLEPGAEPALEALAGPVSVQDPTPWAWYAFWLLLALLIAAAGYYYVFIRKAPTPPPPPPVPHYKRALDALDAIEREKLVEKGLYKEFYIRVSDVLRHYIEGQFGLPASERTTEEFLEGLQQSALLGLTEQLLLKEFLRHCDLVKFAGAEPSSEDIRHTFDTCKQFVKDTAKTDLQGLAPAEETE